MAESTRDVYLVIGGSGFIGRHIVQQLLDRGDSVSILDIVQRYDDVPFYNASITERDQLVAAFRKSCVTCIFHTVSPHARAERDELYWKVNVEGTNNVISAAVEAGVRKLVYTSSSGVVFNGIPLNGVNESTPYCEKPMDVYMETKATAETAVLNANNKGGLLTVAIRPSGVFGPGDVQLTANLYKAYEKGQTHVQIGDNSNLCDWTYVGNVAYAHILAADKLSTPPVAADLAVSGQAFFITNDDPWPFWNFANAVWDHFDIIYPGKRVKKKPFIMPRCLGLIFAILSEWIAWLSGREAAFSRFNVTFSCTARWHNIEKAKKALGYRPNVGMMEGLNKMIDWWKQEHGPDTGTTN